MKSNYKRTTYISIAVAILSLLVTGVVLAGNMDSPSVPTDAGSQMYTLEQIYDRLTTGAAATKMTTFTEPSSGPGSTMHTLDEIMAVAPATDNTAGAGAPDVLSGKTFWGLHNSAWATQTGTMPDREGDNASTAQAQSGGVNYFTAPEGYYDGDDRVSATDAQVRALDPDITAGNVRSGVDILGVSGDPNVVNTSSGDAAAGDILSGKKAWIDGIEVTGNVAAGSNVSGPEGAKSFTIPDGLYSGSKQATANDSNLVASNIKKDVTLFGVKGTYKGPTCPVLYEQRWCDNGDGTVTDVDTGLMWTKNANHGWLNWQAAINYCDNLTYAGYDDWRLPGGAELAGLVNGLPTLRCPLLGICDLYVFTGVQGNYYWSSSTTHWGIWIVNLIDGSSTFDEAASLNYVWPVRGGQ